MSEDKGMSSGVVLLATVAAFVLVLAGFYWLDHFVMSIQGLPLNMNLTPAQ